MLPNFSRLSLEPTGGFVKLTPEKRAEIERNGQVVDPITMEPLQHQGEFFEVQRPHDAPVSQANLYVDPEALWDHVQRQDSRGLMAANRQRIWYEDWWALYYNYGPPSPTWSVPTWVADLPRLRGPRTTRAPEAGPSSASSSQSVQDFLNSIGAPPLPNAPQMSPFAQAAAAAAAQRARDRAAQSQQSNQQQAALLQQMQQSLAQLSAGGGLPPNYAEQQAQLAQLQLQSAQARLADAEARSRDLARLREEQRASAQPVQVWGRVYLPGHVVNDETHTPQGQQTVSTPEVHWFTSLVASRWDHNGNLLKTGMASHLRTWLMSAQEMGPLANVAGRDLRTSWSLELKDLEWRNVHDQYKITVVRFGIVNLHPEVAQHLVDYARSQGDAYARAVFGFAGPPRVGMENWPRIMTPDAFEREERQQHWTNRPQMRSTRDEYKFWVDQWPREIVVAGVLWLPGTQSYHSGRYQSMSEGFGSYMAVMDHFREYARQDAAWWARHVRFRMQNQRLESADVLKVTYELWGLSGTQRTAFLRLVQEPAFSYKRLFNLPEDPIVVSNQEPRALPDLYAEVPQHEGSLFTRWGSYDVWYAQWAPHLTDVYLSPFNGARASPLTVQGRFWLPGDLGEYMAGLNATIQLGFARYMAEHAEELFGPGVEEQAQRIYWAGFLDLEVSENNVYANTRPVVKVTYTLRKFTFDQIWKLRDHMAPLGDNPPRAERLRQVFGLPMAPRVADGDFPRVVPEGRALADIDDRRLSVDTVEEYLTWNESWAAGRATIQANAPTPAPAPQEDEWPGLGNEGGPWPMFRPLPAESDGEPMFRPLPAEESDGEPVFRSLIGLPDEDEPQYQSMSADSDGVPPPPYYANGDPVPQLLRRDVYRDRVRQEDVPMEEDELSVF